MTQNKLDTLLKQDKKIFHTNDLGLLWDIENKNSLYKSISRLVKKGTLFSIHKGLYSVLPINDLDPIKLGVSVIHKYNYLSCETILAQKGIILQATYKITFVSENSKNIMVGNNNYLVRKLKSQFLYNTAGVYAKADGVLYASTSRAVADMLYFQPSYHFDAPNLIDWKKVKDIQLEVGY